MNVIRLEEVIIMQFYTSCIHTIQHQEFCQVQADINRHANRNKNTFCACMETTLQSLSLIKSELIEQVQLSF